MAWTTPQTVVADSTELTAALWNEQVRDNTLALYAQSQYPYRNLLYNGAMQVSQRGTSTASITTTGYYTADRWQVVNATLGTWTQSVAADAPTAQGFRNSLKMLCTTADASPAAGDVLTVQQTLEGYDVQRVLKGTASAQTLRISFWVKSNQTGTYVVECADYDNSRSTSQSYTITASDTWEQKTITIPADTTGTLNNDNGASLGINFWLAAGSNYTSGTLATVWGAQVSANRAVGQTNLAAATNNYWQVTGVQLEVGSVATPFEFLPYGDELARCQRYYWHSYPSGDSPGKNYSGTAANLTGAIYALNSVDGSNQISGFSLPVTMRATPTLTFYSLNGTVGNTTWYPSFLSTTYTNIVSGTSAATQHGGWVGTPEAGGGGGYYTAFHAVMSAEL